MQLTREIIAQIVNDLPASGCIECGGKYFHAPLCQKGFGLDSQELVNRLKDRAEKLQFPVTFEYLCSCNRPATGTFWVAYHGYTAILSAVPMCESCSNNMPVGDRPQGFLPGTITKDTTLVTRRLQKILR